MKRTIVTLVVAALLFALHAGAVVAQAPLRLPAQEPSQEQSAAQPMPARQAAPESAQPAREQQPSGVLVKVNEQEITSAEVDAILQNHLRANPQIDAQAAGALRDQLLDDLINDRLVEQFLAKQGVAVAEEEVNSSLSQLNQQLQAQGVGYEDYLRQHGLTDESLKRRIQGALAWQRYQQQATTEDRLRAFYEQNQEQFQQQFAGQDYAQIRPHVAQAYAQNLRNTVVAQARADAKIEKVGLVAAAPPGGDVQPRQPQPAQPPAVVAKVNDEVITQQELEMSLQPHLQGNPQVDAEARQTLQERVLTSLIDSRLVEQQLRKEGPDVSAQEVETVVEQIKGQSAAQGSSLDQVLQSTGLSEKDFEKRIEGSLAWQKYQRQAITEPSLQEYYEQNQGQFGEQPFEQVRPQVAQSYASGLWKSLADKARPDAKIEVVAPPGQVRQPPSPADRPVILDSPSQPIDESRSGR